MSVKLDVPYFYQTDNPVHPVHGHGWRQCNLTSNAMFASVCREKFAVPLGFASLESLAKGNGFTQPEAYYGSIVARYGDTIFHFAQTKALLDLRIRSEYTGMDDNAIKSQLDDGLPVVVGVKYKSGGHIICLVGYDDEGYWTHDPYGSRQGASNSYIRNPTAGKYDKYSYGLFNKLRDWMGRKYLGFNED